MRTIYAALADRPERDRPLALATIVDTVGSAPQVPGASALFSEQGLVRGTLGGGRLEAEADRRARAAVAAGRSELFRFDLRGEGLEDEEPVCGGEATILIDASPGSHLDAFRGLRDSLAARRRGVLLTQVQFGPDAPTEVRREWLEEGAHPARSKDMEAILREDRPALRPPDALRRDSGRFDLLEPLAPPPRLLVAGAGHIGQAVARLAGPLGFEVTVVDDRADFASRERFPDADCLIVDRPDRAVLAFDAGADTYIVIVTRGHRDDADVLRACIRSAAAYVGMIGSRSKVGLVRATFLAEGWATPEEFDRVHTPIGLPIGSRTVEEIAVSIAAELVQVRSRLAAAQRPGGA